MHDPTARPDVGLLAAILDSLPDPVLLADATHTIRYMNRAAAAHYSEGAALLGRSLLDCHNAESNRVIRETLAAMQAGEQERLISEGEGQRVYMRAVRAPGGELLGYYERYEKLAART
ncbi:MAG: PAS domain-containing protein [Candidatus Eisenbacteria bacterium]|nr:PAS domain-containing protein [Candidatus Eisenbacteria bacterium]